MFIPSINHVFSLFSILTIYGKFRTDLLTEMAPHAGQRFRNERRMVSLSVERIGYFQHIAGTEFHAKAAPLASVLDDINICRWCQIFFPIKGFSPHLHWHDRTFSNNRFTCNWPRTFPLSHLPLRLGQKKEVIFLEVCPKTANFLRKQSFTQSHPFGAGSRSPIPVSGSFDLLDRIFIIFKQSLYHS
jgi:hypothetical protein